MSNLITTLHCIINDENDFIADILFELLAAKECKRQSLKHLIFILDYNFKIEDMIETLQLLQDDLGTKLYFYSGMTHHNDSEISFEQEINLISSLNHKELYSSLYSQYVKASLIRNGINNNLFSTVSSILNSDIETINLVKKLWHTQGNISQSASELYVHRNTLIYRIDRMKEMYFLDLKDPSVLLIAYLLV